MRTRTSPATITGKHTLFTYAPPAASSRPHLPTSAPPALAAHRRLPPLDGLENKLTVITAAAVGWLEGPRLSDLQHTGPLPPGALGYACAKAATICRAGIDVEFHQLAGAIHLFGDGVAWLAREARK